MKLVAAEPAPELRAGDVVFFTRMTLRQALGTVAKLPLTNSSL